MNCEALKYLRKRQRAYYWRTIFPQKFKEFIVFMIGFIIFLFLLTIVS